MRGFFDIFCTNSIGARIALHNWASFNERNTWQCTYNAALDGCNYYVPIRQNVYAPITQILRGNSCTNRRDSLKRCIDCRPLLLGLCLRNGIHASLHALERRKGELKILSQLYNRWLLRRCINKWMRKWTLYQRCFYVKKKLDKGEKIIFKYVKHARVRQTQQERERERE